MRCRIFTDGIRGKETLERQLYRAGGIFWAAGLALAAFYLHVVAPNFPYPCMFFFLFGWYCPGCGGTRALEALLCGRFLLSLWYHPAVLYGAVLSLGFMGTHTLEILRIGRVRGWKFHGWYLYGGMAVIVINWIVKNILLHSVGLPM